jgi:hypothetical protein
MCVGDINNDKKEELIVVCENGSLLIYSFLTDEIELIFSDKIKFSIDHCKVAFLREDHPVLLLAGHDHYLRVYEYQNNELNLRVEREFEGRINSMKVGDIFYDKELELVISSDRYITISGVSRNSIQNFAKTRFNGEVYSVTITKFKDEPHNSIIFGCRDNKLHLIQYQNSFFLKKHLEIPTGYYGISCSIGDISNDNKKEIVVIGADNTLRIIHYEIDHLKEIFRKNFKNPIKFLGICDLDADGIKELVVLNNLKLKTYKFTNNILRKITSQRLKKNIKNLILLNRKNSANPYFIVSNFKKEVFFYTLTD